jgi:hypothetical protein
MTQQINEETKDANDWISASTVTASSYQRAYLRTMKINVNKKNSFGTNQFNICCKRMADKNNIQQTPTKNKQNQQNT